MLTALLNMALGHGPWTFYQAIAWAAVGTTSRTSPSPYQFDGTKVRILPMAILAFAWGLCSIGWYLCQHWPFTNRLKRSSHSSLQVWFSTQCTRLEMSCLPFVGSKFTPVVVATPVS